VLRLKERPLPHIVGLRENEAHRAKENEVIEMVKFFEYAGRTFVTGTDKEKRKKIKEMRRKNPNIFFQKKTKSKGSNVDWWYATWQKSLLGRSKK
jgi:hypothetical protein